jgi:predicted kinase
VSGMSDPGWAARVIAAAVTPATRLVTFVGVPGAGKSTIASILVQEIRDVVLISSDEIRGELGDKADQSHTPRAFEIAYERLGREWDAGRMVIWDAVNAQVWARRKLIQAARGAGVETLAVHLRIPLLVALARNEQRTRPVRPGAIEQMHQGLAAVTTEQLRREGFTRALELGM